VSDVHCKELKNFFHVHFLFFLLLSIYTFANNVPRKKIKNKKVYWEIVGEISGEMALKAPRFMLIALALHFSS
jgi:hypothetical protein